MGSNASTRLPAAGCCGCSRRYPPISAAPCRPGWCDERPDDEIAAEPRCSESVVRKRVSRGVQSIRAKVKEAEL